MNFISSSIDINSQEFLKNYEHHKQLNYSLRKTISITKKMGTKESIERHIKRGKLTARDRIKLLLD